MIGVVNCILGRLDRAEAGQWSIWIISGGLLILALLARVLLIWQTKFDGLYGQDPFAYLDYAAALKLSLARGEWPPPFFWPIGYPTLIIAFSLFLPLNSAAQAVSVIMGALAGVLAYLITREILDGQPHATAASLFAGLIITFSGQLLISSLSVMSDAAGVFWASLSAFALIRSHRSKTRLWLALAGFALGWAMVTRWVFTLLVPVWAIALLTRPSMEYSKTPEDVNGKKSPPPRTRFFARLGNAGLVFGFLILVLLPQIALIAHDAATGVAASHIGDIQTVVWNFTNAWQSNIVNADGHFVYSWPIGVFYALPFIHPAYISPLFTPLILLGLWTLRHQRFFLILILGWIGVIWVFLAGIAWENWRFPLAFLLPLAVLAGIGLNMLAKIPFFGKSIIIGGWIGAGLVLTLVWGVRDVNNFAARQLADRALAEWTRTHVPADGMVITFGITETLQHFTSLNIVESYDESSSSVEQIARERRNVFVLLDVENIESQWSGLSPQVNYHTLRDRFALQVIGTYGPYVLFSIGSIR